MISISSVALSDQGLLAITMAGMANTDAYYGEDPWGGYKVLTPRPGIPRAVWVHCSDYFQGIAKDSRSKVYDEIARVAREHRYPPDVEKAVVRYHLQAHKRIFKRAAAMTDFGGGYEEIRGQVLSDMVRAQAPPRAPSTPTSTSTARPPRVVHREPIPVIDISSDTEEDLEEYDSQERFERLEKTIADLTTLVRDLQQNQQPAPPPPPPPVQIQQPQPIPPPQQLPPPVPNAIQNQPQNVEPQTATGLNLKEFLKLKPLTFEGGINPAAAYEWLAETKKIFKVISCSEAQKVKLASYMLKGEAYRWWNMKDKAEPEMEWRRFVVVFQEKYIPQAIKDAKCSEFLSLKQRGAMTVAGYDAEFTNLAKYGSHIINTDSRKERNFEDGLLPEIRNVVRPLRLATYAEVLDRALLVEQGLEDVRRISEFKKRKANVGKTAGRGMYKRQNTGITTQRNQGRTVPVCAICGKGHSGTCWYSATKCYNCGQAGHIQKNCPQRGTGANAIPVNNWAKPVAGPKANTNQKVGSNQKSARAFALTPGDPRNTESVVAGTIFICSTPAFVLLDSGSTHSFISDHLALKLHKRPEPFEYELVVSQPMNSRTICTSIYRECDVKFGDRELTADLVPMTIGHFDAILGMDWLIK
ncbi:hypothetical protein Vadar_019407 [Vaccinium darrowii]|uniref:Uncharacterized protein n=1 Tax=Vaccinium darrowii TaxID=229202 RepID=A0ACB7XAY4_9ERIC|nr:hypothetical protein Vadar_019407 [Vaccinium darrowii]